MNEAIERPEEFQALPDEVLRPIKARSVAELSDSEDAGMRRGLVPKQLRPAIRRIVSETEPQMLVFGSK